MNLEEEFLRRKKDLKSDIRLHLDMLFYYAFNSEVIAEFGIRTGNSTIALMYGLSNNKRAKKRYFGCDVTSCMQFEKIGKDNGIDAEVVVSDSREITLKEKFDLIFIDTIHEYNHITKELKRHGNYANKWIIMHDTYTFAVNGQDDGEGMQRGIFEWLIKNPHWIIKEAVSFSNGLMVLERVG